MAMLEQDVLDRIEAEGAGDPALGRHVEELLALARGPGALPASVASMFSGLEETDEDRIARRAGEILELLGREG
jgi:hypothetical protein